MEETKRGGPRGKRRTRKKEQDGERGGGGEEREREEGEEEEDEQEGPLGIVRGRSLVTRDSCDPDDP